MVSSLSFESSVMYLDIKLIKIKFKQILNLGWSQWNLKIVVKTRGDKKGVYA